MCGIAALFSADARPLDELLRRMTKAVRHRGPDDEGDVIFSAHDFAATQLGGPDTPAAVYDDARIVYAPTRNARAPRDAVAGLGHRRLSIVDVGATGHQPMCTADQRYWIVYNGENLQPPRAA